MVEFEMFDSLWSEHCGYIAGRFDVALFGEAQSRIVVSVEPNKVRLLEKIAARSSVKLQGLGIAGGRPPYH